MIIRNRHLKSLGNDARSDRRSDGNHRHVLSENCSAITQPLQ